MPRADFYVLKGKTTPARLSCTIAGKAVSQGNTVYILTESRDEAGEMDDLLWTWQDISFLPHCLTGNGTDNVPVIIGWKDSSPEFLDVLINLTRDCPDCAPSFSRTVEIISDDPAQREIGRERFRQYRKLGFELFTHDIKPE